MTKDLCGGCRFFHAYGNVRGSDPEGQCRIRAPMLIRGQTGNYSEFDEQEEIRIWPQVWRDDWCGEFVRALPTPPQP